MCNVFSGRLLAGWILLTIPLLSLAACDAMEEDPDTVPLNAIITLKRVGDGPLLTGGTSTEELVAKIPGDASERVITFQTTIGFFVLTHNTLTVRTQREPEESASGDSLVARAVFRTDTTSGIAYITASVGGFRAVPVAIRIKKP